MSDIKRYDFDKAWGVEKNDDGIYVKYDDHKAIVAQLEIQLAEAKKDQARYCETVKLYISGDLPLELDTAESKKEFDVSIDAAIASIQEGK